MNYVASFIFNDLDGLIRGQNDRVLLMEIVNKSQMIGCRCILLFLSKGSLLSPIWALEV